MNKKLLSLLAVVPCAYLPAHANAEEPVNLEEILVTATRMEQEGQYVPLSWSAVDEGTLQLIGHVHITETMQRIPGAWISRGNGQESLPSLRSPVFTGAGSCGAFFMAGDSISLRAPGFCNINQLFDANTEQAGRIEVIKGPATALYGSNALHGVINVLSAAPSAINALSVEAGPYDYYRGKYAYGAVNGAHGISLRLNGTTDGGYKDDSGYDQQKLTARYDYQGDVWQVTSVIDYANLNQETAGFVQGFKAYEDEDIKDSNPNPEAYRDVRSVRAYSRASRALGEQHTLVLTPYLRDNDMDFLMHFLPWQPLEENGHSSLGFQGAVHSDFASWNWVNGIDLDYTDGWLKETQDGDFSPNQPAGVHYDYQVDALNAALFSQVSWRSGALELSAGLRLDYTGYDYDNRTGDGAACAPEATACRFFRPADRDDSFTNLSANAGASYALDDNHVGYLRLASGFRAPQAAELYRLQSGQRVADLDAEELENIELGLRGTVAGVLAYDTSVYYMEKEEVIFQDSNRQNISGASTSHYGLEISLDYRLAENWYLNGAASFARHRYDSSTDLLGATSDIKGNDIDTAPRRFGSAQLGWEFNADSVAELEWVYLGSYYLNADNTAKYDGHSLLNLRVSSQLSSRWHGTLRVTNLLDEDYAERADFAFGNYRYFVGQPLGAYLEVGYAL